MPHIPDLLLDPARKDVLDELRDLLRNSTETNLAAMADANIANGLLSYGMLYQLNYDEGIRCMVMDAPLKGITVGGTRHRGYWTFKFQGYQLGHEIEDLLTYTMELGAEIEREFYKNRKLPTSKAQVLDQLGWVMPDPVFDEDDGRICMVVTIMQAIRKFPVIS